MTAQARTLQVARVVAGLLVCAGTGVLGYRAGEQIITKRERCCACPCSVDAAEPPGEDADVQHGER